MAIPDYLLDTTWSIQYVSSAGPSLPLYSLFRQSTSTSTTSSSSSLSHLRDLSTQFQEYILSRAPKYKDELNDETEKTGPLRECVVEYIRVPSNIDTILGIFIESRYTKTTYKIVLIPNTTTLSDPSKPPLAAILFKSAASHVKLVKGWLDERFNVWRVDSLNFPVGLVPRVVSEFMMGVDEALKRSDGDGSESESEALRLATLGRVVGGLRITIAVTSTAGQGQGRGQGIAPQLKSMEFEVPGETVGALMRKAKERERARQSQGEMGGGGRGGGIEYDFLEELAGAVHERTGLRLPFTGKVPGQRQAVETGASHGNATDGDAEPEFEPPLKVTRIHCAAFALRVDGGVKLAGKPIEDAEIVGYDAQAVRKIYMRLFRSLLDEAETRRRGDES